MREMQKVDLCVIGAGSAGLSVAAGAAQMGAQVLIIESDKMGGDCLNTGCVPSKSLLASAKAAQSVRTAPSFGVSVDHPKVRLDDVRSYVRNVVRSIEPHDSVDRFTALGCKVIQESATFLDRKTVMAGNTVIRPRRFVIATGSHPFIPTIPGLKDINYFTNENVFENAELPEHLIVIGAGPIGCELAQAHRRLGSHVTLLDASKMLPKDDPQAVAILRSRLEAEGIQSAERIKDLEIEKCASGIAIKFSEEGRPRRIEGSHLLLATGRRPNVSGLNLELAGVRYSQQGIDVDDRLRTSNKRIFAAGDVIGGYQFTHVANYHAGIILRNALFRLPSRNVPAAVPWVTFTDPEIAQVGPTEREAEALYGSRLRVLRAHFGANDRAQADGNTDGFLKVMVDKNGLVLGATIVGSHAGELLLPWILAISKKMKIREIADVIVPYPTLSEVSKKAAGSYYTPLLFSARTRSIVRFLGAFG